MGPAVGVPRARWPLAAILIIALSALACASDTTAPEDPGPDPTPPAFLTATSARNPSAQVATSVTVSVRVTDSTGAPVRGVPVTFVVTQGGGYVADPGPYTFTIN